MAEPLLKVVQQPQSHPPPSSEFEVLWRRPSLMVSEDLLYILASQLSQERGMSRDEGERHMKATFAFLLLFRITRSMAFVPTPQVAAGWQILRRSGEYSAFCERCVGVFIRHTALAPRQKSTAPTVDYMRACKLPFDEELWSAPTGDCEASL